MKRTLFCLGAALVLATTSAAGQSADHPGPSNDAHPTVHVLADKEGGGAPRKITAVVFEALGDRKREIKEMLEDLEFGHKLVELAENSSKKAIEIAKVEAEAMSHVRLQEIGRGPKVIVLLLGAAAHHAFMESLERKPDGYEVGAASKRPHILSVTEFEPDDQ